jgi:dihydroxyacetone kinase
LRPARENPRHPGVAVQMSVSFVPRVRLRKATNFGAGTPARNNQQRDGQIPDILIPAFAKAAAEKGYECQNRDTRSRRRSAPALFSPLPRRGREQRKPHF